MSEQESVAGRVSPWVHTGYAQQIVFGAGALGQVADVLKAIGIRRVLLVTTAGRAASDDGDRVVTALGRARASTFAEVTSHAPTPMVHAAVMQARRDGVDGIVSFGGGSAADTGKAVCFFTEQEQGTPGTSFADRPVLPHVSIPTTYSGAELTPFFGMTDPSTHQKSGAGGPTIAPIAAIYDPTLTLTTPARVSAETGMNALAHCVEVVWSPSRTPEAEGVALAGVARIMEALPRVVDDPDDLGARADMFAGAILAGRGLQNASMGVHHGLAQLVGGRTGIPHGLANAIILPAAMAFNADVVPDAMEKLGRAMGVDDATAAVRALVDRLGLPARLGEVGVGDDDLEAVARLSQSNGSVRANPRPVSEDDALEILRSVA
ncbi:MAG TPA: iron-containing alcohol dehydrogenase [Acidimicrobiales bacterium]